MSMNYQPLPFHQYFTDTSQDYHKSGKARFNLKYTSVTYRGKFRSYSGEYEIHYEEDRNVIQINFQCTASKSDWISNFQFPQKYYDSFFVDGKEIRLKVCSGWGKMYKAMKHDVRNQFRQLQEQHPYAVVEIIGWSLGSGQAQLCAQDLFYNFGVQSYLYTFGSVKPWKVSPRSMEYLQKCCLEIYNFTCNNDIVTYLPPFSGFRMMHRVNVKLDKFGVLKLFNPNYYHTLYNNPDLYSEIIRPENSKL